MEWHQPTILRLFLAHFNIEDVCGLGVRRMKALHDEWQTFVARALYSARPAADSLFPRLGDRSMPLPNGLRDGFPAEHQVALKPAPLALHCNIVDPSRSK